MIFPNDSDIEYISGLIGQKLSLEDFKPLASSGLTHEHILIGQTGWLLRIPRNNQLGMSSVDYLNHQKKIYTLAKQSGVTPDCLDFVPPSESLPQGALVVQYIEGRCIQSENDLPAVAKCLSDMASINVEQQSYLTAVQYPFSSQWFVINEIFGEFFDSPQIDPAVRIILKQEKEAVWQEIEKLKGQMMPVGLIGGDSHLGNYRIDPKGKAWFVDLEFICFDVPGIDAADAASSLTLRLDPDNAFQITSQARTNFYKTWADGLKDSIENKDLLSLCERVINLRTLAWMCYWVDQGKNSNKPTPRARNNWDQLCSETLRSDALKSLIPSRMGTKNTKGPAYKR